MRIEQQVCALGQAKRLSELGIIYLEPEYAFVERLEELKLSNVSEFNRWAFQNKEPFVSNRNHYPAFTVAELGVMLPDHFVSGKVRRTGDFGCTKFRGGATEYDKIYTTESEARAAMLIHLLENNLITADEVNQRLKA